MGQTTTMITSTSKIEGMSMTNVLSLLNITEVRVDSGAWYKLTTDDIDALGCYHEEQDGETERGIYRHVCDEIAKIIRYNIGKAVDAALMAIRRSGQVTFDSTERSCRIFWDESATRHELENQIYATGKSSPSEIKLPNGEILVF